MKTYRVFKRLEDDVQDSAIWEELDAMEFEFSPSASDVGGVHGAGQYLFIETVSDGDPAYGAFALTIVARTTFETEA